MSGATAAEGAALTHGLGYWTQDPLDPTHSGLHEGIPISEPEAQRYLDAILPFRALTERTTFILLQRNRHALETTLEAVANVEQLGGSFRRIDTNALGVTLMGELLNWLAAGRLYIVSTKDFMRRQFGDTSDQMRRFAEVTSKAFDDLAGYRFMYNLRDYSQHCGAPVSSMSVSRGATGQRQLDLLLSKSQLRAASFNWSSHVEQLFEVWPEQIPLMPLLVEAMEAYARIEDEVLRILIETCVTAAPVVREGIELCGVSEPRQHPAVLRIRGRDDGTEGIAYSLQSFPESTDVGRLLAAASLPDPLANLRTATPPPQARNPAMLAADRRAAAVVSVRLDQGGPTAELDVAVRSALDEAGALTIVSGLMNLTVQLSTMIAMLIGSTPQAVIGGFVHEAEAQSDEEGAAGHA